MNYSVLEPLAIKAFHLHKRQTDVWYVPPTRQAPARARRRAPGLADRGPDACASCSATATRAWCASRPASRTAAATCGPASPGAIIYFVDVQFSVGEDVRRGPLALGSLRRRHLGSCARVNSGATRRRGWTASGPASTTFRPPSPNEVRPHVHAPERARPFAARLSIAARQRRASAARPRRRHVAVQQPAARAAQGALRLRAHRRVARARPKSPSASTPAARAPSSPPTAW